ncbi:substrate-binding domain-containing protein [Roseobacter sinensis]|uniref:Substrate-binding domain-containing protein n=1 Tax=Roseobacter sinensis TaxID=2931391 RepID=A0ABT3BLJ7_9RHOB|nr:substrate-binding domain-containing protein [Roseobacter sp. WL0113]MCV3273989.1 substrate-binding domain-containing protein [Roseobacter sp. WL0113]
MNLRELSERLNLSQTTVSRALNGYPEVSEQTRKRVAAAAKEFNYRPNIRAQRLATGRSMSIGHIIPLSKQNEMVNIVFADFIAGAGEVYARHGYNMSLSLVRDEEELNAYRGVAEKGAVDGIIVHSPARHDPRIAFLAELDIPFLVHGRASEVTTPYAWLDVNNKRAIETGTRHLLELGHRRIALVNGEERMDFAQRRREGYLAALCGADVPPDPGLMRSNEMSEPYGHAAAHEMLDRSAPPTAFVASSIVSALGIRRAIQERGLVMGRDISVLCFDDEISYLPNGQTTPVFTAMRSSVRAAGRRCAELLIDQITHPDQELRTELWDAELVIGPSTGPCP